jgi:hypothetical protein
MSRNKKLLLKQGVDQSEGDYYEVGIFITKPEQQATRMSDLEMQRNVKCVHQFSASTMNYETNFQPKAAF